MKIRLAFYFSLFITTLSGTFLIVAYTEQNSVSTADCVKRIAVHNIRVSVPKWAFPWHIYATCVSPKDYH